MRVLFLNQYFPPDPAPTGVLLRELADALAAAGHEVDFVSAGEAYRTGQRRGRRMWREAAALRRMLWKGLRRPRADVVLSASSPPCLLLVATLVAGWHRAKSVHWAMDLYPEIAVALGEIRDGALARVLRVLMGWAYRRAAAVVALDEDMAGRLRAQGVEAAIIRPWVSAPLLPALAALASAPQAPWTWLYSGNLGRAHEWETLLAAQALLEQRGADIRLHFQGGGPARAAAEDRAQQLGLRACDWTEYVAEAELPAALQRAEVLVVTQLPAAQGLLWPSKLGMLLALPRPILWIGPTEGAITRLLRPLPHAGVFAPGEARAVADWLLARRHAAALASSPAIDAAAHRAAALAAWRQLLEAVG